MIGFAGETVEVASGQVKVYNDKLIPTAWCWTKVYLDDTYTAQTKAETLKSDEYFVLGDNRAASLDSRYFGPVSRSQIVGRVWLRGWPLDRWKIFPDAQLQHVRRKRDHGTLIVKTTLFMNTPKEQTGSGPGQRSPTTPELGARYARHHAARLVALASVARERAQELCDAYGLKS